MNSLTIGYIVGFIVGKYIEYCLCAQVAVLNHKLLYWTVWDRFMQVLYLGRAPRTKETLPDFREKCWVTRHSRVFRGLTGSQQTLGLGRHRTTPVQVCEGTVRYPVGRVQDCDLVVYYCLHE